MTADTAAATGLLTDLGDIESLISRIAAEKLPFCADIETGYHGEDKEDTAKHPEEAFIVSVQLTNSVSWARMIPLAFDTGPNTDNRSVAALLWPLVHLLDDAGLPLMVAHGAVFELRHMARWFLRHLWDHPLFGSMVISARGYFPVRSCTLLESFVEGENLRHGLKDITLLPAPAGFGHRMRELADLQAAILGKQPTKRQKDSVRFNIFNPADPEVVAYGCEDVIYGLGHHLLRYPRVATGPRSFIYRLEMEVLPLVCEMADYGVCYDWAAMREAARRAAEFGELMLAELIEDFSALAGRPLPADFNFGSSQQLATLFYDWCGMPVVYRTPGGKPSVDQKHAIPQLAKQYPVAARYAEWRRLETLRVNFLESFENDYSYAADGLAHPGLLQHGTVTGRFSCEQPNYQQSPGEYHIVLRSGERFDFSFRTCIVAPPAGSRPWWSLLLEEAGAPAGVHSPAGFDPELGWYILGFDYSQIELRVIAAHAGETALLEAFEKGLDCHRTTAALMLGIADYRQVTKEQRQSHGKRPNFAICYQMGPKGMSEQYGMTLEAAREMLDQYHSIYPRLKPYTSKVVAEARRSARLSADGTGEVIGKFGRKVKLWNLSSPEGGKRAADDRTAGNAVVQGPATGDYVKMAMVRARKALAAAGLSGKVQMFMNIHDALEFAVRKDVTPEEVIRVLRPAVLFPIEGWPPLVADWHAGVSWGQVIELEVQPDGSVWPAKVARPPGTAPEPAPAPAVPATVPAEVSPAPVAAALPEPGGGPSRTVLVMLSQMPYTESYARFLELVGSLPGGNTVMVDTPEGRVTVAEHCGLGPEHQAQVAVILGGAEVAYAVDSVDSASLGAGLEL